MSAPSLPDGRPGQAESSAAQSGIATVDARRAAASDKPGVQWLVVMLLLILAAMTVSGLLLVKSLTGGALPGCSPGSAFDCDSVLATPWAHVAGVPVSALALLMYAAVLFCVWLTRGRLPGRRLAGWQLLLVLAASIFTSAVWFVGVQIHLERYCLYCMMAHGLGLLLSVMLIASAPFGKLRLDDDAVDDEEGDDEEGDEDEREAKGRVSPRRVRIRPESGLMWMLIGLLLTVAMVTVQIRMPGAQFEVQTGSRATGVDFDTGPGPERKMSILGGQIRLSPHHYPIMGSADAKHIIVYLFDYTCPNCRVLHKQFEEAIKAYQGRLGIVKLVVPLDAQCNPYVKSTGEAHRFACELAKLSLAVWMADPAQFEAYDRWLSEGENAPWPDEARAKAIELVGQDKLDAALRDDGIQKRIDSHFQVYGLTGGTVVPQFIIGNSRVFSRPDQQQLWELFEKELGLPVPAQAADKATQ